MKLAATHAIAALAVAEGSEEVATAYGIRDRFGPDYLIPQPFDRRLITHVAPAVPEAAMLSGVATRPLTDLKCYRDRLARFVYHSGTVMQPVFGAAAQRLCRIVYAEGEDERVLRAAQVAVDERLVHPVLIGRPAAVAERLREFGLPLEPGREVGARPQASDAARGRTRGRRHALRFDRRLCRASVADRQGNRPTRRR